MCWLAHYMMCALADHRTCSLAGLASKALVDTVDAQVEEAVASETIVDVAPLLPSFMDAHDHAAVLQKCPSVSKGVLCVCVRACVRACVGVCTYAHMHARAHGHMVLHVPLRAHVLHVALRVPE